MKKRLLIAVVIFVALLVSGLAGVRFLAPRAAPPTEEDLNASKNAISTCNDFAFKLFTENSCALPEKNIFVAPVGTYLSLSILLNGAGGETREALEDAIGIPAANIASFNTGNAAFVRCLKSDDRRVRFTTATSLWLNEDDSFLQDYLDTCRDKYGAQLESVDFSSKTAESKINAWISKKTSGRIRRSVSNLNDLVVSVLINAAYFNGIWTDKFGKNKTKEDFFRLSDGRQVKVPMMRQTTTCGYLEDPEFQAINLPYGNRRFSMYIFLPREYSGLSEFCGELTAQRWDNWMQNFREKELWVMMPRFRLEQEADLKNLLSSLGLDIIFDPERADFSSSVDGKVWIDRAKQSSFIEVNEKGTEIAVSIQIIAVKSKGPPRFVADHPFFYAIRDNLTETILFMGTVVDPSET